MKNKIVYGVTGILNTPDEIMAAAKKITTSGYTRFDINTPYPIHGMPQAMKLKSSPLGYFALALGLSGAVLALLFMTWTMTINYPLIIGGKPFFSLPAFIPVTFEVTVLLASVATVVSMVFLLFRLPNNSHPLHDTNYIKLCSSDKYGVCLEAKDPKFNQEEAVDFLKEMGADNIEIVYYDNDEITFGSNIFNPKFIGFLVVVAVMVSGAAYFGLNKLSFMNPFNWMMDQFRYDVQSSSEFFEDGRSMRMPVGGTISRGHLPYMYADSALLAEAELVNPLTADKKNLETGKKKYDTYCSPCHGNFGDGDSRLRGQFPNPPSLHSEKARNWKDGMYYHIITMGQNSMPSYARQLNETERWQVIHYVRALQRAKNATGEDMK